MLVLKVELYHTLSWPNISFLAVSGSSKGWTYVPTLETALLLSLSRRNCKKYGDLQGGLGGGQIVEVTGLQGRKDLNGQFGITARFIPAVDSSVAKSDSNSINSTTSNAAGRQNGSGARWEVLLSSGEGVRVRPANLKAAAFQPPACFQPPLPPQKRGREDGVEDQGTSAETECGAAGPGGAAAGRVLVFWGVARWTRAQLLGEIARGHW